MIDLGFQSQIILKNCRNDNHNTVNNVMNIARSKLKTIMLSTFLVSAVAVSTNANAMYHHNENGDHNSKHHVNNDNTKNHDKNHTVHNEKHVNTNMYNESKHNEHNANKHNTEMKQHTKHNNDMHNKHHIPHKYDPTSVYHRGTKTNLFGTVDFHYAFLDNEDKFKLGKLTRDHVMSTTYSVGGEAEIWINKDTRVGAIVGLAATKDKRYVFDVVSSSDPMLSKQNNPVSLFQQGVPGPLAQPAPAPATPTPAPSTSGTAVNANLNLELQMGTATVLDTSATPATTTPISTKTSGVVDVDTVAFKVKLPELTTGTGTETVTFTAPSGNEKILTASGTLPDAIKSDKQAIAINSGKAVSLEQGGSGNGLSLTTAASPAPIAVKKNKSGTLSAAKILLDDTTSNLSTTDLTDTNLAIGLSTISAGITGLTAELVGDTTTENQTGATGSADIAAHNHPILKTNFDNLNVKGNASIAISSDQPIKSVPVSNISQKLLQKGTLELDDAAIDPTNITSTFFPTVTGTNSLLSVNTETDVDVTKENYVDPLKIGSFDFTSLAATVPKTAYGTVPDASATEATVSGNVQIADDTDISLKIPTKDIPIIAQIGTGNLVAGTAPLKTVPPSFASGASTYTPQIISIPITGAVTASGVVDGLASTLTNYARVGDAKATFVDTHLERAAIYVESKFGRFEAGMEDGPEVKLRTDASTIAHGTGGINGVWHYYANLSGIAGPNLLNVAYSDTSFTPSAILSDNGLSSNSYFFYQPSTFSEFNLENAPKISFYSPDFGGFRIGMSYTTNQSDDNPYKRFANKNEDSYADVLTGAAEYSFMMNDMEFTTGVFGEFAARNEKCLSNLATNDNNSNRCVQNYYDLKNIGFGGSFSLHGIRVAGSYVNLKKSGQRMDLTWNPDWYASNAKNNPAGTTAITDFAPTENVLYAKAERPETKRGIPTKVLFKDFALVQVAYSTTSTTEASVGGSAAPTAIDEKATGGIAYDSSGNVNIANALFPFAINTPTANTEIPLAITPADTDDDSYGEHDSYYWTLGAAYEMGPAGFSITYMNSKTQQNDAWGGRTRLRNFVASFDYEIAKGFAPYIELSYFKTEDKTYGFLDMASLQTPASTPTVGDITSAMTSVSALQDTLFAQMYGDSIYLYSSDATKNGSSLADIKKSIEDENKGYTIMVGAKMNF